MPRFVQYALLALIVLNALWTVADGGRLPISPAARRARQIDVAVSVLFVASVLLTTNGPLIIAATVLLVGSGIVSRVLVSRSLGRQR